MEAYYYLVFGVLVAVLAALEFSKSSKDRITTSAAFNAFKNNYLVVYSLMMAGDWLQGPYVYALYQHYNYSQGDIGRLFIAGFGSSMLFGTIVGSLGDRYGRKRASVTYCITYILSCITKHSPQYRVLMLGRILGGIATSLLFSAFESWLVAEHFKVQSTLYASIEEQQKIQWLLYRSILQFSQRFFNPRSSQTSLLPGSHCCYQ
jgi:MFS family permease